MNMKKTMAAIAAGAVAVSAMATTVSAVTLETKTLTYNLVKTVKEGNDAEVKLTAKFFNVPLVAGETARFSVKNLNDKDIIRISGVYIEEGKQIVPITATKDAEQAGIYSIVTANAMTTGANGYIDIPVVAANATNGFALMGGTAGVPGTPGVTAVAEEAAATAGSIQKTDGSGAETTLANLGTLVIAGPKDADGNGTVADGNITLTFDGTKWYSDAGKTKEWTVSGFAGALTPAANDTITIGAYVSPVAGVDEVAEVPAQNVSANITVEITKKKLGDIINELKVGNSAYNGNYGQKELNEELAKGATSVLGAGLMVDATPAAPSTNTFNVQAGTTSADAFITASDFTKTQTIRQYPYKSSLNNNLYTATTSYNVNGGDAEGGDIFNHVYEVKTDDTATQINRLSIQSVINDAISKYDDVTFVFNTATKPVKAEVGAGWYGDTPMGAYDESGWAQNNSATGVKDFSTFGNHIYNANQWGYDPNTSYILNEWKPDNLFSGALLVNSTLTLSLTDTQKFDWTEKSLSFTWEAVQDAALTNNAYANYVQNMVLRTSADWYWDNFQVVLGETEVEEVESGAPVEGDEADLPEDPADIEDTDEPEEPVEEPEEPAEDPVEEPAEEPAQTATNPGTGNASVALAVIPVALAAAAIVAKKRG